MQNLDFHVYQSKYHIWIRVKNEENSLTIFARVVGGLPETGDNSKVLIKLSQAAFEQLKGVNARFPVEILY